jgi:hypothetical protein
MKKILFSFLGALICSFLSASPPAVDPVDNFFEDFESGNDNWSLFKQGNGSGYEYITQSYHYQGTAGLALMTEDYGGTGSAVTYTARYGTGIMNPGQLSFWIFRDYGTGDLSVSYTIGTNELSLLQKSLSGGDFPQTDWTQQIIPINYPTGDQDGTLDISIYDPDENGNKIVLDNIELKSLTDVINNGIPNPYGILFEHNGNLGQVTASLITNFEEFGSMPDIGNLFPFVYDVSVENQPADKFCFYFDPANTNGVNTDNLTVYTSDDGTNWTPVSQDRVTVSDNMVCINNATFSFYTAGSPSVTVPLSNWVIVLIFVVVGSIALMKGIKIF